MSVEDSESRRFELTFGWVFLRLDLSPTSAQDFLLTLFFHVWNIFEEDLCSASGTETLWRVVLRTHIFFQPIFCHLPPFRPAPSYQVVVTQSRGHDVEASSPSSPLWYELVQVKRRKKRPPRMPLALSTRMSHIQYHTDRHNNGRGWHGHFFIQDLGLALVAKRVPTDHRPSKRSIMVRRFRSKQHFFSRLFFLNEPVVGTLRHAYKTFRANIRKTDYVGPILRHIYRSKLRLSWN